eukprot:scaffold304827_cov23-Tisochrysis_lutea.AAC.1
MSGGLTGACTCMAAGRTRGTCGRGGASTGANACAAQSKERVRRKRRAETAITAEVLGRERAEEEAPRERSPGPTRLSLSVLYSK